MVRKLLCALVALAMLLLPAVLAGADAVRPMVVDDAGLFSAADIAEMEKQITELRSKYKIDAVVLTTTATPNNASDSTLMDWADRYYEDNGYGMGEDRAGVIYMIDMNNRAPVISTAGVMIDYLSDSRLEDCHEAAYDYLSAGRYGKAALAVVGKVTDFMRRGLEEGTFRYDAETGERLSGMYNKLTGGELLVAIVAGLIAGGMVTGSVRGGYSLKGSTYRYDAAANTSCDLTRDNEQFLRQTVTRARRDTNSGGGSGSSGGRSGGSAVHRSSSGMSHGGSVGRRF